MEEGEAMEEGWRRFFDNNKGKGMEVVEEEARIIEILENPFKYLDLIDIFILKEIRKRKAICFPHFYHVKLRRLFKLGYEGARKRFEKLVKLGFLAKSEITNPKSYELKPEMIGIIDRILIKTEKLIIK